MPELTPNSFKMMAMRWLMLGSFKRRITSVVLPEPRKPVIIVTGIFLICVCFEESVGTKSGIDSSGTRFGIDSTGTRFGTESSLGIFRKKSAVLNRETDCNPTMFYLTRNA